jgi:hypothetical protein
MLELLRHDLGTCAAVVTVSERSDGDVHPVQVSREVLAARQMAATTSRWVMLDQVHGVATYWWARRRSRVVSRDPLRSGQPIAHR